MSTPRTDAALRGYEHLNPNIIDFARQLETELNEMRKEADREHAKAVELSDKLIELRRQVVSILSEIQDDPNDWEKVNRLATHALAILGVGKEQ